MSSRRVRGQTLDKSAGYEHIGAAFHNDWSTPTETQVSQKYPMKAGSSPATQSVEIDRVYPSRIACVVT
jgi:hypothetical protein